jgi:hypothetical protein
LFTNLKQNNIPFIILKGWSFIPDLYPDPALRPFSDVDILIHSTDYQAVTACLTDLGYTAKPYVRAGSKPAHTDSKPAHTGSKPAPTHIPLEITFSHPAGIHIDLHTHILTLAWWQPAFSIDLRNIWHTAQPYQDSTGLQLQRLSPEVTFLHLCLHLWNHEPFNSRFHTYTDLVLLLRKYSHLMDWDHILQLTMDWHMQNLVFWVSQILQRDFHTTLPIEIQPKSHPKSLQQRYIKSHFAASLLAGFVPAPKLDSAPSQSSVRAGLNSAPAQSSVRAGLVPALTPWRSAFLLRLALIDDLTLLPKLLFSALFPNPALRTAIHNQPSTLLQHWTTYTRRLLRQ